MSFKVAVASSDGKVINQHFGKSKQFLVFEVDDRNFKFIELRENIPPCMEFQHDEDALFRAVELISDCKAIFVSKIGGGAVNALSFKGIKAFETPDIIEDVMKKIVVRQKYLLK